MTRRCSDCDRPFQPARSFHRKCWSCWKAGQDQAVEDQAYRRGYADGYQDARKDQPTSNGDDTALVKAAVRLTHPDRHPPERQAEATRTTQELLARVNGKPRVETRSLGR
jgi:hypothetical protein